MPYWFCKNLSSSFGTTGFTFARETKIRGRYLTGRCWLTHQICELQVRVNNWGTLERMNFQYRAICINWFQHKSSICTRFANCLLSLPYCMTRCLDWLCCLYLLILIVSCIYFGTNGEFVCAIFHTILINAFCFFLRFSWHAIFLSRVD